MGQSKETINRWEPLVFSQATGKSPLESAILVFFTRKSFLRFHAETYGETQIWDFTIVFHPRSPRKALLLKIHVLSGFRAINWFKKHQKSRFIQITTASAVSFLIAHHRSARSRSCSRTGPRWRFFLNGSPLCSAQSNLWICMDLLIQDTQRNEVHQKMWGQ